MVTGIISIPQDYPSDIIDYLDDMLINNTEFATKIPSQVTQNSLFSDPIQINSTDEQ